MKREDLAKLGLTDEEQINKIMALHGQDIEAHKSKLASAQTENDAYKAQLAEANKAIEGFKGMDIEGVKKSADEWKAKAEEATKLAAEQVTRLKFEHALDGALTGAKAKNAKAVRALLQEDALKLNEDGTILGLNEQLEKIKSGNDFLFESDTPPPKIVAGGKNQSITDDTFMAALRKGAGLPGG